VITLDTVRADAIGAYGQEKPTTPRIDEMAAEGVLFMDVVSSSPSTLPSHATIFTGKQPFSHGVRSNVGYRLPEENVTLAEVLAEHGWVTRAEVAAPVLAEETGLDQGFGRYRDPHVTGSIMDRIEAIQRLELSRSAEDVTARGLEFLREHAGRPFLLWLHYFDAHKPYDPPEQFAEGLSPYHAEIRRVDHHVGMVLDELEALGLRDRTLVVLTADHGEGQLQHGEQTHSFYVYDSTIRVPLVFWGDGVPQGLRIRSMVRSVDVTPTALALLELPRPAGLQGVSLVPLFHEPGLDLGLVGYGESIESTHAFGSSVLRFVRVGPWKYIHKPEPELYQVVRDPREVRNVVDRRRRMAGVMRKHLAQLVENAEPAPDAGRELDAARLGELRQLGYVAADFDDDSDLLDTLELRDPDPNSHVEELALYTTGWGFIRNKNYDAALENANELMRRLPDSSLGQDLAVSTLIRAGRGDELIEILPAAIERSPDNLGLLDLHAALLVERGKTRRAEQLLRTALSIDPCAVTPRLRLARLLGDLGHEKEQIALLEEAHRICAADPRLDNGLAYCLATATDPVLRDAERALELSRGVVEREGETHPGHLDTLASAYAAREDFERAVAVQREVLALVQGRELPPGVLEEFERHLAAYEKGELAR
jgi:arylsulfatase A-like enzyme